MFLNIYTYLILPIYSLFYVRGSNLLTSNFSVLGSEAVEQIKLLIWGVLLIFYFYIYLFRIIQLLTDNRKESVLLIAAMLLLAMSIMTPFIPQLNPFRSQLHILFAASSSLLLLVGMYLIVWKLYRQNRSEYLLYLMSLHFIALTSAGLFLYVGYVSSVLELFFSLSCVMVTCTLYKQTLGE